MQAAPRTISRNVGIWAACLLCTASPLHAAAPAKIQVILWFDTEDYLLPASDDAALRQAEILTQRQIRATFKVVGEKARVLEKRGRKDAIAALRKHEIGYHSNFHSTQPTPALYLSNLGWDDGVAEFERRERGGLDDVKRIFGTAPTCYGQPGASWGPQAFGAMRQWGMGVYLDYGLHVGYEGKPHYYCGIFTLYQLQHTMHARHSTAATLKAEQERFLAARQKLLAEGGGVISVFAHPCEWVHASFWDGANFKRGANPPRDQWKPPAQLTADETKANFARFEELIQFMQRFPDVEFLTASELAKRYRDRARGRSFDAADLRRIATAVTEDISFQKHADHALSAAEVFLLLNSVLAGDNGKLPDAIGLEMAPLGPTGTVPALPASMRTDASQFIRSVRDVADSMKRRGRIPAAVWLGSTAVPPEAFLRALAEAVLLRLDGKPLPETITVPTARLAVAKYVAEDDPKLWGWVIFPPGFRAPALMELARRQAWTLKPALPAP